ncbi:MAG TPA: hypothetical protein VM368_05655 [Flavisolibacter sp.]|nr:hypothetical protein [Flavisolibacter sp.]
MGEVEIDFSRDILKIYSHIIIYGNAANESLAVQIRDEIETMWNEPLGVVEFRGTPFKVVFIITSELKKHITELDVLQNTNPKNNYFRIEEFAHGNISFVDGLGCNSGYFKLENLYKGSTTAAHEYGHTLGLHHPKILDIRGKGVPGIMYPRGTLVDAPFQYDPLQPAGSVGGTMHPMSRKVKQEDITALHLEKLVFERDRSIVGEFSNVYHWNHAETPPENFIVPPIFG